METWIWIEIAFQIHWRLSRTPETKFVDRKLLEIRISLSDAWAKNYNAPRQSSALPPTGVPEHSYRSAQNSKLNQSLAFTFARSDLNTLTPSLKG